MNKYTTTRRGVVQSIIISNTIIILCMIIINSCIYNIDSLYHTNMKHDLKGRNEEKHDEMEWVTQYRNELRRKEEDGIPDTGYNMVEDRNTHKFTGMQYKIIGHVEGVDQSNKRKIKQNDKIKLLYKMYLLHNREHIHSLSHPDKPLEFVVSHKRIVNLQNYDTGHSVFHELRHNKHIEEGFEEIIEHHMHYGEMARIIIPPDKGHGEMGNYYKGIPPNAFLELYLEILPYEDITVGGTNEEL